MLSFWETHPVNLQGDPEKQVYPVRKHRHYGWDIIDKILIPCERGGKCPFLSKRVY